MVPGSNPHRIQNRSEILIKNIVRSIFLLEISAFRTTTIHTMRRNDGKMVVLPPFLENVLLVIRLYFMYPL